MEDLLKNLTKEQKNILKKFRKNLEDILRPDTHIYHTDYHLVKFLRARNFNLKESERIFRINYYNRRTFGVNTILETYEKPKVAKCYETIGILGFAKNGSLIHYTACGRLDFYGFVMSMSTADLCLYFSHMMDYDIKLLKDENIRTGKNIPEAVTFIMDLEGFSIQQVLHKNVIEMGIDFVALLQETYPEIWSEVLVVNAPKVFDKAFAIFKPVLRDVVLERVLVADKSSSKGLLLKYIDENVLPAFLGGKRVDSNGDPECKEFITFGGKVPEKFYGQYQRIPLEPSDPDVICANIGQRSTYNMSIPIHEPGAKIRLQFRTNGSVSITLFWKGFELDPNEDKFPAENEYLDETSENFEYRQISVDIRVQAHCTQEDCTIEIEEPGIYVVRFSNARNWFTSRKLLAKLEVIPPVKNSVSQ